MKEYNKLMRELNKDKRFKLIKTTNKPTVKLVHNITGELYSIHPGDNAVTPLKKWVNKFE